MDEQLLHDPRTKQQIKDLLYAFLYSPLLNSFQKRLDEIIHKNAVYCGNGYLSFTYKGEMYAVVGSEVPRKMNRLAKQLVPYMDEYIVDLRQLNNYELPYVLGFIGQVLNSSNYLHDYLLLLPSSIHRPVEKLINSCPCKTVRLTQEKIEEFTNKNKVSIDLMKQRMVTNLLI